MEAQKISELSTDELCEKYKDLHYKINTAYKDNHIQANTYRERFNLVEKELKRRGKEDKELTELRKEIGKQSKVASFSPSEDINPYYDKDSKLNDDKVSCNDEKDVARYFKCMIEQNQQIIYNQEKIINKLSVLVDKFDAYKKINLIANDTGDNNVQYRNSTKAVSEELLNNIKSSKYAKNESCNSTNFENMGDSLSLQEKEFIKNYAERNRLLENEIGLCLTDEEEQKRASGWGGFIDIETAKNVILEENTRKGNAFVACKINNKNNLYYVMPKRSFSFDKLQIGRNAIEEFFELDGNQNGKGIIKKAAIFEQYDTNKFRIVERGKITIQG